MSTWLQLAIALISLAAAGVSAYNQVRKRYRAPVTVATHGVNPPARPVLNGFTEILREALDKLDLLRKENEQLRIRIAELEAHEQARQVSRPRRKTAAVGGGGQTYGNP